MSTNEAVGIALAALGVAAPYLWPKKMPRAVKIAFACGIILILGVAAILLLRDMTGWPQMPSPDTNAEEHSDSAPSEKNSISIEGSNNQVTVGHIGDVTINQAPRPKLELSAAKVERNEDGTYSVTSEAEIVSPYPPGSLRLEAWASGIIDLEAIPQRTGIIITGHTGVWADFAFTTLMQPFGKYLIVVRVSEPTNVELKYEFDK